MCITAHRYWNQYILDIGDTETKSNAIRLGKPTLVKARQTYVR